MRLSDRAKTLKLVLQTQEVDVMEELFMNQLSMKMQLHHIEDFVSEDGSI